MREYFPSRYAPPLTAFLTSLQFVDEKREMDEGAALIERCWRGFWARRRKNQLLYARETDQRQNQVRLLKSEEQFQSDYVRLLKKRLKKVRRSEERSEELTKLALGAETACACTSVQDAPPPYLRQ